MKWSLAILICQIGVGAIFKKTNHHCRGSRFQGHYGVRYRGNPIFPSIGLGWMFQQESVYAGNVLPVYQIKQVWFYGPSRENRKSDCNKQHHIPQEISQDLISLEEH